MTPFWTLSSLEELSRCLHIVIFQFCFGNGCRLSSPLRYMVWKKLLEFLLVTADFQTKTWVKCLWVLVSSLKLPTHILYLSWNNCFRMFKIFFQPLFWPDHLLPCFVSIWFTALDLSPVTTCCLEVSLNKSVTCPTMLGGVGGKQPLSSYTILQFLDDKWYVTL